MKIAAAHPLGLAKVYDLSVDHEHHSFVHETGIILHNCAFVISNEPVANFIPTAVLSDGTRITEYVNSAEDPAVEDAGGVKMDFLQLKTLRDIQGALKLVQQRLGYTPKDERIDGVRVPGIRVVPFLRNDGVMDLYDVWKLPEDQAVFKDICNGDTATVFQFGTPGARQWMENFVVKGEHALKNIEHISAFTALDRPGPLDASVTEGDVTRNMLQEFAARSRGEKPIGNMPVLDKLFPETHGVVCVAENSRVRTGRGLVRVEDVEVGDVVQTESGRFCAVEATHDKGHRECVRVRMSTGEDIVLTADHRILTSRGWIESGALHVGRDLVRQYWASDVPIEQGDDKDWVLGLLLADGNLCTSSPEVACSSREFALGVKSIADAAWGLDCSIYQHGTTWHCRMSRKGYRRHDPNPLTTHLRTLGLIGKCFDTKEFPSVITTSMLAGFFEGDGCVANRRLRVKNERLARQFWLGLQRARIEGSLQELDGVWSVSVHGRLPLRIKQQVMAREGYAPRPELDFIPRSKESDRGHRHSKRPFIARSVLKRLYQKYRRSEVVDPQPWGRVISVVPVGVRRVFDLTVAGEHSFTVGGSVVHNCYQEQLQQVFVQIGQTTAEEGDEFRVHVSKKKMEQVLKDKAIFMPGAIKILGESEANRLWGMLETFGQYGFNKSHSVCYALTGYVCAWLKHHYPLEWWTSCLRNADRKAIDQKFWVHCRRYIRIPDVKMSQEDFSIEDDAIRAPLRLLTGVGDKAHEELVAGRPYNDIRDFIQRIYDRRVATGTTVEKIVKKRVLKRNQVEGGPTHVETRVKEIKLGRSSLNKTILLKLVVSGAADSLFPPNVKSVFAKLNLFAETWADVYGLRRKDGTPKVEQVDPRFEALTGLQQFLLKKTVLPSYADDLGSMVAAVHEDIVSDGPGRRAWHSPRAFDGDYRIPLVKGDAAKAIMENQTPGDFDFPDRFKFGVVAYVNEVEWFWGGQAARVSFEVDGERLNSVMWPRRVEDEDGEKRQVPPKLPEDLKGSVAVLTMVRWSSGKSFSLDDIVIVEKPFSLKAEEE